MAAKSKDNTEIHVIASNHKNRCLWIQQKIWADLSYYQSKLKIPSCDQQSIEIWMHVCSHYKWASAMSLSHWAACQKNKQTTVNKDVHWSIVYMFNELIWTFFFEVYFAASADSRFLYLCYCAIAMIFGFTSLFLFEFWGGKTRPQIPNREQKPNRTNSEFPNNRKTINIK